MDRLARTLQRCVHRKEQKRNRKTSRNIGGPVMVMRIVLYDDLPAPVAVRPHSWEPECDSGTCGATSHVHELVVLVRGRSAAAGVSQLKLGAHR